MTMGGPGSGRWRRRQPSSSNSDRRITVESCLVLDAYQLLAKGCLEPGWAGVWQWTTTASTGDQAPVYSIALQAEAGRLLLSWTSVEGGGAMAEVIPIVRIPCGYGSHRPLFVCPGRPSRNSTVAAATTNNKNNVTAQIA
jgi:hypothetical protein